MGLNILMLGGDTSVVRGEKGPFYNTLSEFHKYWDQIDILTFREPGVPCFRIFGNVTFYTSPWHKRLMPWFIWQKGQALAAERHYDLITSHDFGLFHNGRAAAALGRRIGTPYISEIHHVEGYPRAANGKEQLQRWLAERYVRWARHRALGFRIVNRAEIDPLLARWGVPPHQRRVIYSLYIDQSVFYPTRAVLEYDVLFVGRLMANKAPVLMLDGLAAAARQLDRPLRVMILGRGPEQARMATHATQLGLADQIKFKSWVETPRDVAELMRRSRLLLMTSYSEGGPRVVAEALACGTPVVATRVGLAAELVRDGENGFLIDWDAEAIGRRVAQIASDYSLRQRMAANAPAAVAGFEKTAVIRAYAEAYHAWLAETHAP